MKTIATFLFFLPFFASAQLTLRVDTTFGVQGMVHLSADPSHPWMYSISNDIGLQQSQKIIVAGYSDTLDGRGWHFTAMRLHQDGTVDPSFGQQGAARVRIWDQSQVEAMAIQADDKIVLAGIAWGYEGLRYTSRMAIARFTVDGQLDPSFGNDGTLILNLGWDYGAAHDVFVQADGKIVVLGRVSTAWADSGWGIVRLMPDGSPDSTFGNQGVQILDWTHAEKDGVNVSLLLADGSMLMGGYSGPQATVIKLTPDGQHDLSWGVQGHAELPEGAGMKDLKLDPNGKIMVAMFNQELNQMITVRLLPDGLLDPSFHHQGYIVLTTDHPGEWTAFYDQLEVLPSGDILNIGAQLSDPSDSDEKLSFWWLDKQGNHDTSLGEKGYLRFDLCEYGSDNFSAQMLPDSTILLTGDCGEYDPVRFMVVKLSYRQRDLMSSQTPLPLTTFPNPTSGPVTILVSAEWEGEHIYVTDLAGRLMLDQIATTGENRFELQEEGLFVVRIGDQRRKILVQR